MTIGPDTGKRAGVSPSEGQPTSEKDNPIFWLDEPRFGKDGRARDLPPGLQPSESEKERHRIFASLVLALGYHFWCGNRFGVRFGYPLNPMVDDVAGREGGQFLGGAYPGGEFLGDTYLGHNIAAIATDHLGQILDFEFNHNAAYASSAEHAENRLVRRLFRIANANSGAFRISEPVKQRKQGVRPNSHKLNLVTLYTSLESCAQCSGSMSAGSVKQVVYLQPDPGAYLIGNIMFRLGRTGTSPSGNPISFSPLPIAGDQIGFKPFDRLEAAYDAFTKRSFEQQFCADVEDALPEDAAAAEKKKDKSLSSFLCTREAWAIYRDEALAFEIRGRVATEQLDPRKLQREEVEIVKGKPFLEDPDYRPAEAAGADQGPPPLTNLRCLQEAYAFLVRARERGQRGIARGG